MELISEEPNSLEPKLIRANISEEADLGGANLRGASLRRNVS